MKKWLVILFCYVGTVQAQVFQYQNVSDTIVSGITGDELIIDCNMINNSASNIFVEIFRLENNLPAGWDMYFCADICYGPSDDYGVGQVLAGSQQSLTLHFLTSGSSSAAQGNVLLKVRNYADTSEVYTYRYYAETALSEIEHTNTEMSVYPNPCNEVLNISIENNSQPVLVEIYDLRGSLLQQEWISNDLGTIDVNGLAAGQYLIKMISGREVIFDKLIKR